MRGFGSSKTTAEAKAQLLLCLCVYGLRKNHEQTILPKTINTSFFSVLPFKKENR